MGRIQPRTVTLIDGTPVVLRSAEPTDAAAMLAYYENLDYTSDFTVTQPHERKRSIETEAAHITEYTENPSRVFIVAMAGDHMAGELSFKGQPMQRMAHHGHFGIGVHSDWRSRGIGRLLIETLLDWAREHPVIEKVCLGVFADNHRAIALYRRMGFVEEGRRIKEFKFGPDRYCDDIQMSLWVKPPHAPRHPSA